MKRADRVLHKDFGYGFVKYVCDDILDIDFGNGIQRFSLKESLSSPNFITDNDFVFNIKTMFKNMHIERFQPYTDNYVVFYNEQSKQFQYFDFQVENLIFPFYFKNQKEVDTLCYFLNKYQITKKEYEYFYKDTFGDILEDYADIKIF